MPVVVPLSEKPEAETQRLLDEVRGKDSCEHVAWEVGGYINVNTSAGTQLESRKCSDCGFHWREEVPAPTEKELAEAQALLDAHAPGKPPKAVYGHAQVVTYQTAKGQYDLVVGELAMVSTQNGLIVVQHHDAPVVGIVGVRPWLEEDHSGAESEG